MMRGQLLLRIPILTAHPCLVESPPGSGQLDDIRQLAVKLDHLIALHGHK
jgi:hypothetical protein